MRVEIYSEIILFSILTTCLSILKSPVKIAHCSNMIFNISMSYASPLQNGKGFIFFISVPLRNDP